jgi:hypothetical protein
LPTPDRISHPGGVERPDRILLRLRLLRWQTFLRSCLGRSRGSRFGFGSALFLVCLSAVGSLWRRQAELVSFVDHHATAACGLASIGTVSVSLVAGQQAARGGRRDLATTWLAILPWPDQQRKRALMVSCLPPFGLMLVCTSAAAVLAGALIRPAAIPALVMTELALVAFGFVVGLSVPQVSRASARAPATGASRPSMSLFRADQARPRWLGSWAMDGRGQRLVRLWLGLIASLGVLGVAGSVETGTAAPAAMIGIVGGHIVFLIALRARPLRADALRLLPVSFLRAAWGVARLPLLLSFGWFVLPEAAAFAAAPGNPAPVGGAIGLLLLDGLAGLSSLWLADAPAAALLLHGTVLLLGVQYWARLGLSELFLLPGLCILLWRGARRRFIEGINRHVSRNP